MREERRFLDTNVLLYLHSADVSRADQAESLVRAGGVISVQVLNELTSVLWRKFSYSWVEIDQFLNAMEQLLEVQPLTLDIHRQGRSLAARYGFNPYDAMIVAAAQNSDCHTLYSEDMQNGMVVDSSLRIINPFV
ncbi:MAG TPA: VapC toxin family PIN domain ribonuclease [Pseudohongiella sp.]|nr:VapC toxin family PIN domain ribonuclease [Pseudohongiella sp.]HBX38900.1 VapC toxin family PIN domain ribonuclease [Pseudohongiella sp.]|tara:strand:- start:2160 stop:2564 length:405 start_codon:yes stop_codon:yes gene_type:complete